MPDAPLSHFAGVRVTFTQRFLGFVELQMHPYHTLQGSGSLLPSLFKVCKKQVRPLIERITNSIQKDLDILTSKPRNPDEGLKMNNDRTAELIGSRKRPSPCRMDIHTVQMHPQHTLQGSGSLSPRVFQGSQNSRCTTITLCMGQCYFYLVFFRFVECQMHPYHTLQGSGSLLPSLFKVSKKEV